MQKLETLTGKLTRLLGFIGCLAILAMMVHIVADVVLRSTINTGVPATEELVTRYYMVTLALLPLAWVEWKSDMITVDVFADLFKGLPGKILAVFSNLVCVAIYVVFAYSTFLKAVDQYETGTYVMSLNFPMPVWPTYFAPPVAFALAALIVLLRLTKDINRPKQEH
jgi:TRAP-type C4-dicarboxylate transport system permease small subunit